MPKLLLVLVLAIFSMTAWAQPPFLVELTAGQTDVDADAKFDGSDEGSTSGDDTSVSLRLAYQFNPNLAVDLAYQDHGESKDSGVDSSGDFITQTFDLQSVNLSVKGIYPINRDIWLVGRAGVAYWDGEVVQTESSDPNNPVKVSDTGFSPYLAAGVEFQLIRNFVVGLEVSAMQFDLEDSVSGSKIQLDTDVLNVSIYGGKRF